MRSQSSGPSFRFLFSILFLHHLQAYLEKVEAGQNNWEGHSGHITTTPSLLSHPYSLRQTENTGAFWDKEHKHTTAVALSPSIDMYSTQMTHQAI